MLSQHSVSILEDRRIPMISRFEESSCNDGRHRIPEEEVLLMTVNRLESMIGLTCPNIPPRPIKPIADEEFNSFGYM
jgi:hypothetical protein